MKTFDELKVGDEIVQYIKNKETDEVVEEISKVYNIFQNTIIFDDSGEPIISTKHINLALNNGKAVIVERNNSIDIKNMYLGNQVITATGKLIELDWK